MDRRTQFVPDFLKPLPLAVVVAENVDGVILPQPAVKLLEKFAPLRLGNLRFRRAFGQRTEGVQVFKLRMADWRMADWLRPARRFQIISIEVKPRRFNSTRKSGHEMKNGSSAGICCA